jgi:hypothetical protein
MGVGFEREKTLPVVYRGKTLTAGTESTFSSKTW